MDWKHKTIIVTGATSGIGRATAIGLARLQARLLLVGRDPGRAEETLSAIRRESGRGDVEMVLAEGEGGLGHRGGGNTEGPRSAAADGRLDRIEHPMYLLLLPLALAGDDVLWYTGHDGYDGGSAIVALKTTFLDAGAPAVDEFTAWPGDLSTYRVVFLTMPTNNFTATEVTNIVDFIAGGGTLVPVADGVDEGWAALATLNQLFADLGLLSTYLPAGYDADCGRNGRAVAVDPLTDGFLTMEYGYSSDMTLGPSARLLVQGESGQVLVATESRVVLATDCSMFFDTCATVPGNQTFLQNLYDAVCAILDFDGDGFEADYCGGDDCDDDDATINPTSVWHLDADGDGLADPLTSVTSCEPPDATWQADAEDCDDSDPTVTFGPRWYQDIDGDGQGDAAQTVFACEQPEGFVDNTLDCDVDDASIFLDAPELCDELDNDCDGVVDEEAVDGAEYYPDLDQDGYGVDAGLRHQCDVWEGASLSSGDCDDGNPEISPDADERCDHLDNNCDGQVDEDVPGSETWYTDADGDGHGDPSAPVSACFATEGLVEDATDCDDTDAAVYPDAPGFDAACGAITESKEPPESCGCAELSSSGSPSSGAAQGWMLLLPAAALLGRRRGFRKHLS